MIAVILHSNRKKQENLIIIKKSYVNLQIDSPFTNNIIANDRGNKICQSLQMLKVLL